MERLACQGTTRHDPGRFQRGAQASAPLCGVTASASGTGLQTRVGGTSLNAPWPAGSVTPASSSAASMDSGEVAKARDVDSVRSGRQSWKEFRWGTFAPTGNFRPVFPGWLPRSTRLSAVARCTRSTIGNSSAGFMEPPETVDSAHISITCAHAAGIIDAEDPGA
jgi:hypothetical protein